MLSTELERRIIYQPATVARYILHLLSQKNPLALTIVQTILHVGLRCGQAATVDQMLVRLLEREPTPIQDYIRAKRRLWMSTGVGEVNGTVPR